MKKPVSKLKSSFSLRKPVSTLSGRAVRAPADSVIAAPVDMSKRVLRLLTDKKPNADKFAARPLVTRGLTIAQLLSRARDQQMEYSAAVIMKNTKRVYHKKTMNQVLLTETYSRKTGKNASGYDRYVTYVEALPTKLGTLFNETRVKVACSCPFFTYFSEVALAKYNAADVQYSNGEDPVDRNPKQKAWCCKHVIKVLYKIQEKGI